MKKVLLVTAAPLVLALGAWVFWLGNVFTECMAQDPSLTFGCIYYPIYLVGAAAVVFVLGIIIVRIWEWPGSPWREQ